MEPPNLAMLTDFALTVKTLCFHPKKALHDRYSIAFSISFSFLLLTLFPLILKLVIYFSPLLSSTAACFTVFYLFVLSERHVLKEMLLVQGEKSERGVVQVYDDEVNCSIYDDHTEACCFLLRSKPWHSESEIEEEGEKVTVAGKLHVGFGSLGVYGDEVASCVVDRMAEGAWNCYFGKSSKWHYVGNLLKDGENQM